MHAHFDISMNLRSWMDGGLIGWMGVCACVRVYVCVRVSV